MARFDTIGTTTSSTSLVYPSLVTFLSPPGGEGGQVVYAFRFQSNSPSQSSSQVKARSVFL